MNAQVLDWEYTRDGSGRMIHRGCNGEVRDTDRGLQCTTCGMMEATDAMFGRDSENLYGGNRELIPNNTTLAADNSALRLPPDPRRYGSNA